MAFYENLGCKVMFSVNV